MKTRKIISMTLACLLLVGFNFMAANAASNGKAIQAGSTAFSVGDTVYYGVDGNKWRVLSLRGNGGLCTDDTNAEVEARSAMFLFSEAALFQTAFDDIPLDGWSNDYSNSTLKTRLEKIISAYFTEGEQAALLKTTKGKESTTLDSHPYSDPGLRGDRMFALSANELQRYLGYNDDPRTFKEGLSGLDWWLRSAFDDNPHVAGAVHSHGYPHLLDVDVFDGWARPAFNLNLKSVLFTSAAEGGKSSGALGADALQEIASYEGKEWKVTLKDKARVGFEIDSCLTGYDAATGVATVSYKGAKTGAGEYISALIKDSSGAITYYGRIAKVSSEKGFVTINTIYKLNDGDKLYVFNEQYHEGAVTDYASELQEVKLQPAPGHDYGEWEKLDEDQHYRVCSHDDTHIEKEDHKWDAGTVTTDPTIDKDGERTYTCEICKAETTEIIPKLTASSYEAKDSSGKTIQSVTWQKGSGKNLDVTFKRNEDDHLTYGLFDSLGIDDKTLESAHYDAAEGSLKISIKPEYLEKLSVGNHNLNANFQDGSATVKLIVLAEPNKETKPDNSGVKTSDESNLVLWSSLMLFSITGVMILLLYSRKRIIR